MNKRDTATTMDKTNEHRPGFKWTKLGWVPEEWEVVKSSKAIEIVEGQVDPKQSKYSSLPHIGPANMEKETGILLEYNTAQEDGIISGKYLFNENHVLYSKIRPELSKVVFPGFSGLASADVYPISSKNGLLIPSFLKLLLLSKRFYHYSVSLSSRTSGMPKVNRADLMAYDFPLPPLPEQKKIAAILSTWDAAIQALQELIAAKEQQQKGLMHRLLTGAVRFGEFVKEDGKKDTALGKIPRDWTLIKAGEIFESVSIKNNEDEPLLAVTQENGVIPRDMLEGRVMMPSGDTNSYKLVVPGNFVISLRSFQGGIEYSEYRGIVSPAYTVINHKIPIVKSFFRHFFKSAEFIGRLSIAVIGIRDGKQISFRDFAAMKFRFPSLEEQERITTVLNEGEEEISVLNQKLDTLKTQKKGLMQRLLTGEVRTI